jgi:hypothetical protein
MQLVGAACAEHARACEPTRPTLLAAAAAAAACRHAQQCVDVDQLAAGLRQLDEPVLLPQQLLHLSRWCRGMAWQRGAVNQPPLLPH